MFGVLIGIFATLSYALDAFRSQSNEIFIMKYALQELHVLWLVQLCEYLGRVEWAEADYVHFRWDKRFLVFVGRPSIHLRQENAELVGKARSVCEVGNADHGCGW